MSPPALVPRFAALAGRLGSARDASGLGQQLLAAWAQPHRTYHGTAHLVDCLERLDEAPDEGADRDAAEAALWYHDAVYELGSTENERRSAEWAARSLVAVGVDPDRAAEVGRLVELTTHHRAPADATGALVCDVDLSILGRGAEEYAEFERRIRKEYAQVPEPIYRAERSRVLRRLLDREPLYGTKYFRERCEAAARTNLERALQRLAPG